MKPDIHIPTLISFVLTGNGITHADIPEEFSRKAIQQISETDISEFMSAMMNVQKTEHILVITKLDSIADMIGAINLNLKSNKISVLCNGRLDTSALEEEMIAISLHTADGKTFIPESIREYPCLMHADSRLILKRTPRDHEEAVFNMNGETVGVLLDESLRYENIEGTVDLHFDWLSLTEKATLLLSMLKERTSDTARFADILLLKGSRECKFIILPSKNTQNICDAELELFTGLTHKNTFCEMIGRLAELSLPSVLFEDLSRIVTSFYISPKTALPHHRMIINTMERILITEDIS